MVFDALLRFSPFYLIVEISAGASLKAFGVGVFSIDLAFTLEGPTPWRARGRGSVSLLFIEISANFDRRGASRAIPRCRRSGAARFSRSSSARRRTGARCRRRAPTCWSSLRKLELPGDELVLHPFGTLEVSQNFVPLGFTLEKVGRTETRRREPLFARRRRRRA